MLRASSVDLELPSADVAMDPYVWEFVAGLDVVDREGLAAPAHVFDLEVTTGARVGVLLVQ